MGKYDNALIGGKSNGWRVANSTLMFERSHLGSGTVPVPSAIPWFYCWAT